MIHKAMFKPAIMGALMGTMMLIMLHAMLTGDNTLAGTALLGFAGAHVAIFLVLALAGFWATRYSPRATAWLARVHRPSLRHFAMMALAAVGTSALLHLVLHGGI